MAIKKWKSFNENLEIKNLDNLHGVSAHSSGIIEYGQVEIELDGESIIFTIQQGDSFKVFLNDHEFKEFLSGYGVEFKESHDGLEIVSEDFNGEIFDIYSMTSGSLTGNWERDDVKYKK